MKTNRMKLIIAACVLFTGYSVPAFSQKDAKKEASKENKEKFEDTNLKDDVDFVLDAADAGMYEVQVAQLAKTNSSSAKVKELADHMIKDHSKANEELKSIAARKNITLPSKLSDKKQKEFDELTKLKGVEFDKEYSKEMVKDHKDAIDKFQKEADKGMDGELKAWSAGKIATLKHHLGMAEATHDAVK
jgi:putative membrane protein